MKNRQTFRFGLGAALLVCTSVAIAQRPTAITNARIHTMAGEVIEAGTVIIRDGKIAAVGSDVDVPGGAIVVDAKGGTVMPGLVSAYSTAGLQGPRAAPRRGGRGQRRRGGRGRGQRAPASTGPMGNNAATKVADGLYARQDVFRELLDAGVTSLAVAPAGAGFPGQGALLDPSGADRASLVVNDSAFIAINPANNTRAKTLLKDSFALAAEVVEDRKNPGSQRTGQAQADQGEQQRGQQNRRQNRRGGGRGLSMRAGAGRCAGAPGAPQQRLRSAHRWHRL